jgi:squalene synthase HpnC
MTAATRPVPGEAAVLERAATENFSVASLVLGRETRDHLLAIYGFARLVDQLGDDVADDRLAHLDRLEQDLGRVYEGDPEHPIMRRLAPTVRALGLPRGPFVRLIDANRRDQVQATYATYADLVDYCDLSANPVGELVLHVFGAATPERIARSDDVCTALQLVEHWQDVGEDARNGRIYLPAEHRRRHEVEPADLLGARAADRLRGLLAEECARARAVLLTGTRLVRDLPGRARVAVAGYAAGGLATLDAVRDAGFDVLGCDVRPERRATARHALQLLTGAAS